MRTLYHEFESLEHLLATRLLPGGENDPIRAVVFGGTGAVGGAAVLDLCQLILMSERYRKVPFRGEIHATGSTDKEITKFATRLYLALEETTHIEKIEPLRHYRLGDRIDLKFSLLRLEIPRNLETWVETEFARRGGNLETWLSEYFAQQSCPFQGYVEKLDHHLLHAVLVSIPLPSVATYTLETIDRLAARYQVDHKTLQQIKSHYLRTFIRGLAVIQQRHARHVVIAHTTAVGGMYRVDGGAPEIRLGFDHTALGKTLVEKKYFADELTRLYLDQGFDVLVTAAAIGIDAVEFHGHLPQHRIMRAALRAKVEAAQPAITREDLEAESILLYPALDIGLDPAPADQPQENQPLWFGSGKELIVDAAIRSGENGLFSVANCIALYNVMKVAIPEELAMVLVRHAVFGPERRRDWFQEKVCYYCETENSHFALRLLDNYPQLVRGHLGAFSIQAYQALGSSTHQARLHELGLLMLVLRLLQLAPHFPAIPEKALQDGLADLDVFFWENTRPPSFEDLQPLDAVQLAQLFGQLCEVESMESAGLLLGYDPRVHGLRERGREKFLARLATRIRRYLQTITSLGIPILYRHPKTGQDRLLVGPYIAPLELAVASSGDVHQRFAQLAAEYGTPLQVARDWTIVNNGFVDLRPHAMLSTAKEPGPQLGQAVGAWAQTDDLVSRLAELAPGTYFTTCGTVALKLRLSRLFATLSRRKIELGTRETWKHLFRQDQQGRLLLAPGLIETVRMYSEGLGKVTGTEPLWPHWGY